MAKAQQGKACGESHIPSELVHALSLEGAWTHAQRLIRVQHEGPLWLGEEGRRRRRKGLSTDR